MKVVKAKELRKNSTDAERAVGRGARAPQMAGYKFCRKQHVGRYIVDFVCFDKQVIVELDGGQHSERAVYDGQRSAWLESQGFRVLRFWNHEVIESLEAVTEVILTACGQTPVPT